MFMDVCVFIVFFLFLSYIFPSLSYHAMRFTVSHESSRDGIKSDCIKFVRDCHRLVSRYILLAGPTHSQPTWDSTLAIYNQQPTYDVGP